ncbi:hypothetical protein BD413DRAFT_118282 [Trametes elegans]|nr:hypothetical protein BD413DRAFT_118282 [Trametes elegans]
MHEYLPSPSRLPRFDPTYTSETDTRLNTDRPAGMSPTGIQLSASLPRSPLYAPRAQLHPVEIRWKSKSVEALGDIEMITTTVIVPTTIVRTEIDPLATVTITDGGIPATRTVTLPITLTLDKPVTRTLYHSPASISKHDRYSTLPASAIAAFALAGAMFFLVLTLLFTLLRTRRNGGHFRRRPEPPSCHNRHRHFL